MISTILFTFIMGFAVHADECSGVRLDQGSGSLSKVPYHFQGDINICSFNVTAQMFDAARYVAGDKDKKHITSPLALAVQRFSLPPVDADKRSNRPSNPRFFFEFSTSTCWDFDALKNAGVGSCDESRFVKGVRGTIPEGSLWERASDTTGFYKSLDKIDRYTEDIEDCDEAPETRVGDNALSLSKFMSQALRVMGGEDKLKAVAQNVCKPEDSKSFEGYSCESELLKDPIGFLTQQEKSIDLLHDRLSSKKPIPQAVVLCAEALINKAKNNLGYIKSRNELTSCSSHSALIAGRRKGPGGKCQFLIRDSVGLKCSQYAFPKNCEDGRNYWIDEDHLSGNIVDIAQIKKVQ